MLITTFCPIEEELMNNPVYASVSQIFDNDSEFYQQSVQIAEHLFEQSNNPNIKSGELYIVHFRNCNVEEGVCDAVGIFKSETKDTFLKIVMNQNTYQLVGESGINIKKLDKACIVFNVNRAMDTKFVSWIKRIPKRRSTGQPIS